VWLAELAGSARFQARHGFLNCQENAMKRTLITLLLAVPFAVSAADGSLSGICSMKASKMTPKAEPREDGHR
jgi:hypothetical protein